jgi:hypothetical protein
MVARMTYIGIFNYGEESVALMADHVPDHQFRFHHDGERHYVVNVGLMTGGIRLQQWCGAVPIPQNIYFRITCTEIPRSPGTIFDYHLTIVPVGPTVIFRNGLAMGTEGRWLQENNQIRIGDADPNNTTAGIELTFRSRSEIPENVLVFEANGVVTSNDPNFPLVPPLETAFEQLQT